MTTASFIGQLNGGNALSSDALPLSPVNPLLFTSSRPFSLWLGPDTGNDRIRGTVTLIALAAPAPTPVPEPGAMFLFGCGLLALAGRMRRRRVRIG